MLKRETIIDRRPTTTTVIIFKSEQNIVCLKALCECELVPKSTHNCRTTPSVDDRSGRKGGHRTNTTTSNDNDYWPSPTTAASCEESLLETQACMLCLSPWTTTSSLHKTMHNQERTKTHTGKVQSGDQILEPKVNNAQAEQQLAQILH
ncbi:hypothetical protein Tsp_12621 [Trichinella spiralis]|uniref:hypothetical protein n=1 Tax=Trichinella spiralis TaxID=6334 RepID=UPI0001EFE7B1|nr:hypothetical protein Tsp_12621 [Trichinella spiralis]